MNIEKEKLSNLIHLILKKAGPTSKVKLAKLLLFAEILHFERTGQSITGLYFVRLKYGPVIAFFDEILENYKGKLWNEEIKSLPIYEECLVKKQYIYSAVTNEIRMNGIEPTIKKLISKYRKKSGTELSNLSHSLPAWKYSEPNEPIYLAELIIKDDKDFFALTDLLEDTSDDDSVLAEKFSRSLPRN